MTWFIIHPHGGPAHLPKLLGLCQYTERAWREGYVHRSWRWVDGPLEPGMKLCSACERNLRRSADRLLAYFAAANLTI